MISCDLDVEVYESRSIAAVQPWYLESRDSLTAIELMLASFVSIGLAARLRPVDSYENVGCVEIALAELVNVRTQTCQQCISSQTPKTPMMSIAGTTDLLGVAFLYDCRQTQ